MRVDMNGVLQQFGLQKNRWNQILCPFHADHRPSCRIYEKSFYCWACGTGGDVITFTAKYLNVTNIEAARYLAGAFGIITGMPETAEQKRLRRAEEARRREDAARKERHLHTFQILTGFQAMVRRRMAAEHHSAYWQAVWDGTESILEHYLDCLEENPDEFYKIYHKEVVQIARSLTRAEQGRNQGTGYGTGHGTKQGSSDAA